MTIILLSRLGARSLLLSPPKKQPPSPSTSSFCIPSTTFFAFYLHFSSLSRNLCRRRPTNSSKIKQVVASQSRDEGGDEGGYDESSGNKEVQEMLVSMVKLQAGELEVNKFIDERARLLTDIAEDAKVECGRIAEDAKRGFDEAGSKILESVEADVQALEEELASVRAEIEADEHEFDEFESNIVKARNSGLFFKGLYQLSQPSKKKSPQELNDLKVEAEPIITSTRKSAGSKTRTAVYGFLIFVLTLTLVEAITSDTVSWPRVAIYLAILVFLLVQLVYERSSVLPEDQK